MVVGSPFGFRGSGRGADALVALGVGLLVFGQVGLLAEVFAAHGTREGLLARVRPDVDVDRVLVLEALAADAAVVQQTLLFRRRRLARLAGQRGGVQRRRRADGRRRRRLVVGGGGGGHLSGGQFHHLLLLRVALLARFDDVDDHAGERRRRRVRFDGAGRRRRRRDGVAGAAVGADGRHRLDQRHRRVVGSVRGRHAAHVLQRLADVRFERLELVQVLDAAHEQVLDRRHAVVVLADVRHQFVRLERVVGREQAADRHQARRSTAAAAAAVHRIFDRRGVDGAAVDEAGAAVRRRPRAGVAQRAQRVALQPVQ